MGQLKSTIVNGNITATSNVTGNKIIKIGGTSDQILLANGATSSLSNLVSIAQGSTKSYLIEKKSSLNLTETSSGSKVYNSTLTSIPIYNDATGTFNGSLSSADLKRGDIILNKALDEPDFFVVTSGSSGFTLAELETRKISLEDYSTKTNTVKSLAINGKTITVTPGSGNAYTLTTQDTTYSAATSSALGLVKSSTTGTTANRDYNVQVNSDGTMKVNVPWTDSNDTKVTQTITSSSNTSKRPLLLGYSYSEANPVSFSTTTNTAYATHNMYVAPSTGELGIQKLTITNEDMINHIEFKRNSWNYIVASGGSSATFGFVAGGKSASGANTTLAIYGDKMIPGQRDNQVDMGDSSYHFKNFYLKGKIYNGSYNYTLPSKTGTLALAGDIPTVNNGTLTIQRNGTTIATFTANQSGNTTANITDNDTDTKNTAGSTNSDSKLFLVGATSQAANPQTYSDSEVYTTNGTLTTAKTQVGGGAVTMEYDSTYKALKFVF